MLGLTKENQLVVPRTCYVMVGDRCNNSCMFCSQAVDEGRLSRISWPEFPADKIIEVINRSSFKRVCLQCTSVGISHVQRIAGQISKKISVSYNFQDISQVEEIEGRADKICIPMDVASRQSYAKIKKGMFEDRLGLITQAASRFPGRIATHLIAGLGESEEEMTSLMRFFHSMNVSVGLFALTPIKGTAMENINAPDLSYYRRLQAAYFKIRNNTEELLPDAFRTSGCDNCNRPFYNESPAGPIYNYPRQLTDEEFRRCIDEMAADN